MVGQNPTEPVSLANSLTGEESPTSSSLNETNSDQQSVSPTSSSSPNPQLLPVASSMKTVGYTVSPTLQNYPLLAPRPATPATPIPPPAKKAKIDHFETRFMIQKLNNLQNQNVKFKKNLFHSTTEKKRKINFAKQINTFLKRK